MYNSRAEVIATKEGASTANGNANILRGWHASKKVFKFQIRKLISQHADFQLTNHEHNRPMLFFKPLH
jgi:hypothetical protein